MQIAPEILRTILVEPGFVTPEDFDRLEHQSREDQRPLLDLFLQERIISLDQLGELIADYFGFRYANLRRENIPPEILSLVPETVARKQQVIAFGKEDNQLKLAMADPDNLEIIRFLEKKTGLHVIPHFALPHDIAEALARYHQEMQEDFQSVIRSNLEQSKGLSPADVEKQLKDLPIVRIVDTLIDFAYQKRASDIHIEPRESETLVRFRIDGILHDMMTFPLNIHELIITRIKILSKMRTDEHRAAQDGKMQRKFAGEVVDLRVSVLPIVTGEKVVMRLLSERSRQYSLEELGMDEEDLSKVRRTMKHPFGMLLSTGPTGSGKTTTVYAIVKLLNSREVNISTIEDPVEYRLEGINQIQVNQKTNLTFALGLRSILRQDPNIVLVGEIRDTETAKIAVNAAMTGQLVLSTLHTTNAVTTLPRLLDMGVEPFLVASTVHLVVAQRLVRKVHQKCITSYFPTKEELAAIREQIGDVRFKKLGFDTGRIRLYRGQGCEADGGTGYAGRIGMFEVLEMSDTLRDMIMSRESASALEAHAIKEGMRPMMEDGLNKAIKGLTTVEEVIRVRGE